MQIYHTLKKNDTTFKSARPVISFLTEITNISTHGKFTVSYDVESLFTNIPLGESIDLAVRYIVEVTPILN